MISNTQRALAHVPICPSSNRLDAMLLLELSARASLVAELLFYRSDDGSKIERPADDPAGQFDAEYDAFLLVRQLQWPINHVAALADATRLALGGRDGHLMPADQELMRRHGRLWPGALEIADESVLDAVVRFEIGKMNDPGEIRRLTGVAYRIVKIAQDLVRRTEAARLAMTCGWPLSDLAEAGKRNWYGTWSTVEPPGTWNGGIR